MDVLDPAFAPAVQNPEPDGLSTRTLLDVLLNLCDERLACLDGFTGFFGAAFGGLDLEDLISSLNAEIDKQTEEVPASGESAPPRN